MTNPSPEINPTPKTDLDTRITGCLPGAYPWDDWQWEALAAGLDARLAALGRAVMREAYQHDWCDRAGPRLAPQLSPLEKLFNNF